MTPKQCKAARILLSWSQEELARRANLSTTTVSQFELENKRTWPRNQDAIRQTLEAAGIMFREPDQFGDIGVRLVR